MVKHAQNPHVLRRARDFYATYCASSDGKNYQGLPCPSWDVLPEPVRGHWYTVALRSYELDASSCAGEPDGEPSGYVRDHLADPSHALEVWHTYNGTV